MGNYTILWMFENPRSGRQARNFTTNAPKILDLKSSSEQIFSRKLPLGAPALWYAMVFSAVANSLSIFQLCIISIKYLICISINFKTIGFKQV